MIILIPAAISATVAVIITLLTHLLTIHRSDRDYLLKKAEELYITVNDYCLDERIKTLKVFDYPAPDPEEEEDKIAASKDRVNIKLRINMLVDVYFDELDEAWMNLVKVEHPPKNSPDYLHTSFQAFKEREQMLTELLTKLKEEISKIRRQTAFQWIHGIP